MRHGEPIKDLLLLLCTYTLIFEQKIKERGLWFFQGCVNTRLEISKVAEDALFEFFHILDGTTEGLKPEYEGTDDICARDMIEPVPEDTCDVFLIRK
jgi:hypothetical protein